MKKEINGKTKIIGIIGKNIENSLSPVFPRFSTTK
jgi:shikimate 5-dehydrogenase